MSHLQTNPKRQAGIELLNKYTRNDMTTRLKDLIHFLDTVIYLNQEMADSSHAIKDWEKFS